MRIALALLAAGAFIVSGCETTEQASKETHEIFVKIDENHMGDGEHGQVKLVIKRDGKKTIIIKGDLDDPEVQEQMAHWNVEGLHAMAGEDGGEHHWVMKMDTDHAQHVIVDIEKTISGDGKFEIIMKGEGAHDHDAAHVKHTKVFIIKGENEEEIRKQLKEHGIEGDFDIEFDLVEEDEGGE
jgi:hypothetical protein